MSRHNHGLPAEYEHLELLGKGMRCCVDMHRTLEGVCIPTCSLYGIHVNVHLHVSNPGQFLAVTGLVGNIVVHDLLTLQSRYCSALPLEQKTKICAGASAGAAEGSHALCGHHLA